MTTSSLKQINISYQPIEDRLLLKVSASGSSEYRLWLTRRFTALLLQVLHQQMDKFGGAREVASSEETRQRLKGGAFEQSYEGTGGAEPVSESESESGKAAATYPLGEDGVLAYRINAGETKEGNLSLQLLPQEGQGINFALDKSMLYMLHSLLEQGLGKTEWKLQEQRPAGERLH